MHWIEVLAGALTGLVVGMTGVGGGALMTPILLLVFGMAPAAAVGTDLWFAALTKLAATRIYRGRGLVDWLVVRRLWMGSLPASLACLALLRWLPLLAKGQRLLKMGVAAAVLLTATGLLLRLLFGKGNGASASRDRFDTAEAPLTVAAGALLGILVTLTSVGAGALGVMLLLYLYPARLSPVRLVATDVVHAIPLALFAGVGHLLVGRVDFALLARLLCGSIPGVLLGASLSQRMPQAWLRGALALILLVTGMKLWWAA